MGEDTQKLSEEVKAEYTSSLADLTFNSRPLINMLTMLAEENITYAPEIVEVIERHLSRVDTDVKLPILYLIDCIVKNVGNKYTSLFSQNIVSTFCNVFKVVDEKTRAEMFKLRQTWNEVFPQKKLYAIDVQINMLDPAWPVTAQLPTSSIHFNPKFLKNSTTGTNKLGEIKPIVQSIIPVTSSASIAPEAITMQQQLIMKQKELLELQQKKLELELLQNQMKLQEQIQGKAKNLPGQQMPQNILVKREVANQLLPHLQPAIAANAKIRPPSTMANATMLQRIQQTSANTGGPKINPVNSALVAASKPIRDPRILRQQQQLQQQQQQQQQPSKQESQKHQSSTSNTQIESKSAILDSPNKVVNSKLGVRENNRTESRLVNNKESISSLNKIDVPKPKAHISPPPHKSHKPRSKTSSSETDSKSSSLKGSSSSSSSLDSPNKSKVDKSESKLIKASSLSNKIKKKDAPTKPDKKNLKESKHDRDSLKARKNETTSSTLFKGVKGSKSRNYIRRNRSPTSPVPAVKDVDLRVSGPPEKHARLQTDTTPEDKSTSVEISSQNKDVDLRQMPALVGKKRHSTETQDTLVSKKSKTEILDELFGNEDTDLRQLPIVPDRPKTPPPPIISSNAEKEVEEKKESPKKPSHLDAVRAKLAMATNKDRSLSGSFHKNHLSVKKDEDLRNSSATDLLNKIIISPEDEKCIKEGNMSNEQGQQIMSKIFAQIENQKLREAQKKDKEDSIMNTSLQPISDDELIGSDIEEEASKSPAHLEHKHNRNDKPLTDKNESNEENTLTGSPIYMIDDRSTGDKDERIVPMHVPYDEMYHHKFVREPRELRRGQMWRGSRRRPWDGPNIPHGRMPLRPRMNPAGNWRPLAPNIFHRNPPVDFSQTENPNNMPFHPVENTGKKSPDIPENLVVESVHQDDNKTMCIDGIPREIRCYDETAIVFMNWDDPREISFQDGNRRVIFGEKDVYLLYFNEPAKEVMINGSLHKIKIGAPTREIVIDGKPYECYFGGPGIVIDLDGQPTSVKLEGPPPQVKIGTVKRTDLVIGKISLIIDAKVVIPVFLDAKVQKFIFNGETHTLKFVDGLKSVLIDDIKMDVEYGGLPKPIIFHDKKYFIRFTVLPRGVQPGLVRIKDMEGCQPDINIVNENSQDTNPVLDPNEPALPVMSTRKRLKIEDSQDTNSNSGNIFQNLLHNPIGNLDVLSSHLMSSMTPAPAMSTSGYSVENLPSNPDSQTNQTEPSQKPVIPQNLDINELFQKLVATGIVTTNKQANTSPVSQVSPTSQKSNIKPENELKPSTRKCALESLIPITFDRPETLKVRQVLLYDILYTGMQCSSCGMRFPPEQSIHYSQHLDWHFRQNRKGKKNIRVAASRQWYYSFEDWKNYEEIEDLEEREKNYFDQQQVDGQLEEGEEEVEIPSVPAIPEIPYARCEVCMDIFDQFFNEEKEEWHLKNAIRVDDKTYHPLCYEDYRASLVNASLNDTKMDNPEESQSSNVDDSIPGLEVVTLDDDDEEEESQTKESEVILGESDESKPVDENTQEESAMKPEDQDDDGDDDDVIINEVVPEKIVVDDDDDDYQMEETSNLSQPEISRRRTQMDDGFMDVEEALPALKSGNLIKVKSEPLEDGEDIPAPLDDSEAIPIDESDQTEEPPEETLKPTAPPDLISSIDGNIELDPGRSTTASLSGKIKINISKPISVIPPKEPSREEESVSESDNLKNILIDPSQPLPPGEEPVQLNLKPALQGVELKKMPPVQRGTELTGMCSIM